MNQKFTGFKFHLSRPYNFTFLNKAAAAIGILFGFMPARRAAALDPIDALRHE